MKTIFYVVECVNEFRSEMIFVSDFRKRFDVNQFLQIFTEYVVF